MNNEQMALYKSQDIIFVYSAVIFNILVSVVYVSTKLNLMALLQISGFIFISLIVPFTITLRGYMKKEVEKKIISLATQRIAKVAPESAKDVRNAWVESNFDEVGQKKLLQKFTVDELYEIVVDVAREILSPELLNEFIKRLTYRLRR